MNRTEKAQFVESLKDKFNKANAAFVTEYRGMSVDQLYQLRKGVYEGKGELKVIKNRLAKIAVKDTPYAELAETFRGPVALAFSYEDAVAVAKAIDTAGKDKESTFSLKVGALEGKVVSKEEVAALAQLPDRQTLLAMFVGGISAPLQNFANVLSAVPRDFANVLTSLKEKKEKEA